MSLPRRPGFMLVLAAVLATASGCALPSAATGVDRDEPATDPVSRSDRLDGGDAPEDDAVDGAADRALDVATEAAADAPDTSADLPVDQPDATDQGPLDAPVVDVVAVGPAVNCGGEACAAPDFVCCFDQQTCVEAEATCQGGRFACDDHEDCPSGERCCADVDDRSSVCAAGCGSIGRRSVCRQLADCGGDASVACCPLAGTSYSVCRSSDC